MRFLAFLLGIISIFAAFPNIGYTAIDFTVTPIKYELNLNPGESITRPASIRNNGTGSVTLPTTTSDFQSNGTGGVPSLVRKSELVFPDQELSTWITLDSPEVTLAAGEEGTINFTIDVPTTATPGGHYGAVLFKNAGSEGSTSGDIKINVDYGILILVNVSGEVVVDATIGEPQISGGGTGSGRRKNNSDDNDNSNIDTNHQDNTTDNDGEWYNGDDEEGNPIYQYPDSCPLGDFTTSKYDGSCFTAPKTESGIDPVESNEVPLFGEDFEVVFTFPIENNGNTHIKPTGKITLKDESGEIIKAIGKEVIANDRGAIIGEKIVDYIPINDQGGNILPQTERIFESQWEGFPYKEFDDEGNPIVNYWSPSEYYTQQNKDDAGFLMFWERVSESRTHKTITAEIEMVYYDEQGNPIEFTTAKEFPIQYIEQEVTLNPYIILALLLTSSSIVFIYFGSKFLLIAKPKHCWSCDASIKASWKTCPHCRVLQSKKAQKKIEKTKKNKKTQTKTKMRTQKK